MLTHQKYTKQTRNILFHCKNLAAGPNAGTRGRWEPREKSSQAHRSTTKPTSAWRARRDQIKSHSTSTTYPIQWSIIFQGQTQNTRIHTTAFRCGSDCCRRRLQRNQILVSVHFRPQDPPNPISPASRTQPRPAQPQPQRKPTKGLADRPDRPDRPDRRVSHLCCPEKHFLTHVSLERFELVSVGQDRVRRVSASSPSHSSGLGGGASVAVVNYDPT